MDANSLKAEALAWLRFGKRCRYVATECGPWYSDVLGIDEGKFCVEVETKVTISDLKADLKKPKHTCYRLEYENKSNYRVSTIPNRFYFMVPADIADKAVEWVKENIPYAGVISFNHKIRRLPGNRSRIGLKAKEIHDSPPAASLQKAVFWRMGNEICGLHKLIDTYTNHTDLNSLRSEVLAAIAEMVETKDLEAEPAIETANDESAGLYGQEDGT